MRSSRRSTHLSLLPGWPPHSVNTMRPAFSPGLFRPQSSFSSLSRTNSEIVDDYDLLEHWGNRTVSQYAPGFAIMQSLTPDEQEELQMVELDLGGQRRQFPVSQARPHWRY